MATLTIPNVPESVFKQLEAQARRHGCMLGVEALLCLEEGLSKSWRRDPRTPEEVERLLEEARVSRESLSAPPLTEEFLRNAKNWGRP